MAQPDFTNSTEFANTIIQRTLQTIRDQKDDAQEQQFRGTITFNPAVFETSVPEQLRFAKRKAIEKRFPTERNFLVLGPYKFERRFTGEPQLLWGQQSSQIKDGTLPNPRVGIATSYDPFLVIPTRWQFTYVNGEVDGFYVGLYAVTRPPRGVTTHTVDWFAAGKASRYSEQGQKEGWTNSYDYNEAAFLERGSI